MSAGDISVIAEEPAWKKSDVALARVKAAVRTTFARSPFLPRASAGEERRPKLTLLLTNDERLRTMNAQFRGKDTPTNVLSFPAAGADGYLGDVAIAFGVSTREAAAAGISLEAHTLHLAVHGVLHLLGYDHVRNSEARVMERLEIAILDELGVQSPYARASAKRQQI
jgi:probable rRNA maturation factor